LNGGNAEKCINAICSAQIYTRLVYSRWKVDDDKRSNKYASVDHGGEISIHFVRLTAYAMLQGYITMGLNIRGLLFGRSKMAVKLEPCVPPRCAVFIVHSLAH